MENRGSRPSRKRYKVLSTKYFGMGLGFGGDKGREYLEKRQKAVGKRHKCNEYLRSSAGYLRKSARNKWLLAFGF